MALNILRFSKSHLVYEAGGMVFSPFRLILGDHTEIAKVARGAAGSSSMIRIPPAPSPIDKTGFNKINQLRIHF